MNKEEIRPGIVVRNTKTGKIGVLYTGHIYTPIKKTEVPIVYQGDDKNPDTIPQILGTIPGSLETYELKPEDILTDEHTRKVCKPDTREACRYFFKGIFGQECARVLSNLNVAEHVDGLVETDRKSEKGRNCGGRYLLQVLERERILLANVGTSVFH